MSRCELPLPRHPALGTESSQANAHCPTCGNIPLDSVTIYNKSLHRQTFNISPILPTCNICDANVTVTGNTNGIKILLLNGTCGSGKTTTAGEFVKNHGYLAIDLDCVLQVVEHKLGFKPQYNADEIIAEIALQVDILAAIGRKIVICAVVEPDDMQKYRNVFDSKNANYSIVLLKPRYEVAVKRTQTRTCFASITPEEWVRHFYDRLNFDDIYTLDNSDMTIVQAVAIIAQKVGD